MYLVVCTALLGGWCATVAAQDNTITFDNSSPPKSIQFLNGSVVAISTAGNLTAKCVLNGTSCANMGGNGPTVTLGASNFSQAADGAGKYPAGTTLTLTPTVGNGDVCVRSVAQGTPGDSGWTGPQLPPFAASVVTVASPNASYVFQETCYNSGGLTTSAPVSVSTQNGPPAPPPPVCDNLAPPGFTRNESTKLWSQLMGGTFPVMTPDNAQVPHRSGLVFLSAARGKYTSVQFTTPTVAPWQHDVTPPYSYSNFTWDDSQIDTVTAPANGNLPTGALITISRCPGDFRVDIPPAQRVDSTDAPSCKSLRNGTGLLVIQYNQTGVSNLGECGLAPGTTYYLNYINADATNGISSGEHTCRNNATTCGVQIRHN